RRRPGRKVDDLAARREDVDPLLGGVVAEALEELAALAHFLLPLEQLAQPGDLAVGGLVRRAALLVAPMRGDAEFVLLVHLERAYLHLDGLAAGPDHRRVDGTVAVFLRCGYVVVELPRNGRE